jgi:hypothetical protein
VKKNKSGGKNTKERLDVKATLVRFVTRVHRAHRARSAGTSKARIIDAIIIIIIIGIDDHLNIAL